MRRGKRKMICYKLFFWGDCHYSEAMSILLQQTLCTHICPHFFLLANFVIMFVSLNSFVNKFHHEFYDEFVGYMNDTYFV